MEKDSMRREVLQKIKEYPDKEKASRKIVEKILSLEAYKEAPVILAFFPLSSEPDISPIFSDSRVLFPYIENGKMKFSRGEKTKSNMGVYLSSNMVETQYENALMLVPLVAYDRALNRLGRGGGYYDRYIREHREKLRAIGVCFLPSFQSAVPREEHDERLDGIITE